MPLTLGNYWIYRHAWKDTVGNDVAGDPVVYDSMYVQKDTVLNFAKYEKVWVVDLYGNASFRLLKDSAGYIIDEWSNTFITDLDHPSTYDSYYMIGSADTVAKVTTQIGGIDTVISVSGRGFTAKAIIKTYSYTPHYDNPNVLKRYYTFYADSIGPILMQGPGYVQGPPVHPEQELVRYHVQ